MPSPFFKFKQFTIRQERSAMKVGVDSVLLGAWCKPSDVRRVLDVGCGTGLLALMVAQKAPDAGIVALEIDAAAAEEARLNAASSPWNVDVVCSDFKEYVAYAADKFDLIISNPPYFANSLKNPDAARCAARHDSCLSYEDLITGVSNLLSDYGEFYCIIPSDSLPHFKALAYNAGLFPFQMVHVSTVAGKAPKRCLLAFSRAKTAPCESSLSVMNPDHTYTDEYVQLTQDYYL